jgi:maleylacetoacetate isomerase
MTLRLHGFFRSSASYRVRIALNLKGLEYAQASIKLGKGEQYEPAFSAISPQNLVPVLEHHAARLYQSPAIIEFLEETYPEPALLPKGPAARARVRSLALVSACEIHPLNNTRVLNYLGGTLGLDEERRNAWYHHWIRTGFTALEKRLASEPETGTFCHGEAPGYADVFLVPQVANANRFNVDLDAFPTIRRINAACLALDPFRRAMPDNQPDAQ